MSAASELREKPKKSREKSRAQPSAPAKQAPGPKARVERVSLRTAGLSKSYGRREVLRDVSIEVRAGEVVGLLGPNGAGKTTTFYCVVGLTRPDKGTVLLGDEDLTQLPMFQRARHGISYLPQEPSVFRGLTVEENIKAILETLPLTREVRRARLDTLLDELSIAHLASAKASALSGGERRRLEITRALVISPSFILLDEPFAGIDPIAVIDIQNIIVQLKERGIGVLLTDHNVRETLGICDRAYILNEGVILEEGSPETIAASPRAREIYLGERFRL
ncbi:MAG: LPS export ABC transporter ATP-binding protein [Deltaproteobacteria bacterium]|nr:LPS export ABC transporter ATP-binding protein [Deltaproteobacteria bacterium]